MRRLSDIRNNKGFTLVELLATLSILSLVTVIVIYVAINVINGSKANSYQVTINNIEDSANGYVLEKDKSILWIPHSMVDYEYQCLTVQSLIDIGYFKGDVLESYVDEGVKLRADNYLYVERDKNTKTITKNVLLVGDRLASYSSLCDSIGVEGNISFSVSPSGWSKEKEITTNYNIYNNLETVSNYIYEYDYIINGSGDISLTKEFNKLSVVEKVNVSENGTLNAKILDKEGNLITTNSLVINKIDNVPPVGEMISANFVSSMQNVTLEVSDNVGIDSYYFGKYNPSIDSVTWTSVGSGEEVKSKTIDVYVSSSGIYYLGVKDIVGHVTVINKIFYQTSLSVSNGSVKPTKVITMEGDSFSIPSATPDDYYVFKGWYTNSSYSGSAITTYTPSVNSTLYGKMELLPEYTISYDANGGTGAPASQTKIEGFDLKLSTTIPTRTGYTFLGWSTSSTANSVEYNPGDTYTSDANLTLYALWQINKVEISFNISGGNFKSTTVTDADGNENTFSKLSDGTVLVNGSTLLQYVDYGSEISAADLIDYNDSSNLNIVRADGIVAKTGEEWKCISNSESDVPSVCAVDGKTYNQNAGTYKAGDFCDASAGNCRVQLFVNWNSITYTVSYDANGGTGAPANQTKIHGTDLVLFATIPTRTGYTFLGWSEESTATSATYNPGDTYTSDANLTLYAVWTVTTYTVSYNANGGTGSPASQTKTYQTDLTLSSTTPTRDCFRFTGWNTEADGSGTSYAAGATYSADADVTLYAQWVQSHSWTAIGINRFNLIEASKFTCGHVHQYGYAYYCSKCGMSANYYEKILKLGSTDGYACPCGWDPKIKTYYDDDELVGSDIYISARNIKNFGGILFDPYYRLSTTTAPEINCDDHTYKISYDANGGSGTMSDKPCVTGKKDECELTANSFTKTGYTFTGWNTEADGSGTGYTDGETFTYPTIGDTKLYAQWEPAKYVITLNTNGNYYASASHIYGTYGVGLYTDTARTKMMTTSNNCLIISHNGTYTFSGVYANSSGTGSLLINTSGCITAALTSTTYTSDTTIYMKWS